jgi:MFS family permease
VGVLACRRFGPGAGGRERPRLQRARPRAPGRALAQLAAAGAALLALWRRDLSFVGLLAATALLGGLCLPFYSLCLAIANDRLAQREMLGASATIYLLVGVGAIAGPPLAGVAMQALGTGGFFVYLAVAQAALGL